MLLALITDAQGTVLAQGSRERADVASQQPDTTWLCRSVPYRGTGDGPSPSTIASSVSGRLPCGGARRSDAGHAIGTCSI